MMGDGSYFNKVGKDTSVHWMGLKIVLLVASEELEHKNMTSVFIDSWVTANELKA